ncbi:MAG: RNA methyltransferase [Prevotellaceae bacterium]|jgi:TrmH family RNA methyltransferase|nr:RNA methyltransferase [Prevotellaceae bacterium]
MLSKNRIKELNRLSQKKYRNEMGVFVAEGNKLVPELLGQFPCRLLVTTAMGRQLLPEKLPPINEFEEVTDNELKKISQLTTPQQLFAVFEQPVLQLDKARLSEQLILALDGIQDPGNMGTILRIADWFGIETVLCSKNCVEVFSPKTVQASMGAVARVKAYTVCLPDFLENQKQRMSIYGTFLSGKSIYEETLTPNGIIVMGSEGKGISPEVERHITHRLLIPSFPASRVTSESLNVGVATAVVCSEFRRIS